jgi:hypothetical protein
LTGGREIEIQPSQRLLNAGLGGEGTMTMYRIAGILFILMAAALAGCSGNVETTDDSTRIETEVPKVEVGDRKPDLDPGTDDDIDVDTPAPGDN